MKRLIPFAFVGLMSCELPEPCCLCEAIPIDQPTTVFIDSTGAPPPEPEPLKSNHRQMFCGKDLEVKQHPNHKYNIVERAGFRNDTISYWECPCVTPWSIMGSL